MSGNLLRVVVVAAGLTVFLPGCKDGERSEIESADRRSKGLQSGEIVATVNGVAIDRRDLESALLYARDAFPDPGEHSGTDREVLSEKILDRLIQSELLAQYAVAQGISVGQEEVQRKFEEIKNAGGGERAYQAFLEDRALDPERVRKNLWRNLVIARLRAKLRAEQKVSQADLRKYYESNPELSTMPGSVELSHILFEQKGGGRDPTGRAERVRRLIAGGLPFGKAASKFSDDELTAKNGGKLGSFRRGELLEELEEAAFSLSPGEVSGPITGPDGVHLIMVGERSQTRRKPLNEVRDEVIERLLDERVEQRIEKLAERLFHEGSVVVK